MKRAELIEPGGPYAAALREFDLREIDSPDARSLFRLKYMARLRAVVGTIEASAPQRGLLAEVGCSQANVSLLLAERGWRAVPVDLLAEALGYALAKHERGTFQPVAGDAGALPLRACAFDAVILGEILEHCPQPAAIIQEACRVLIPGGLLVVTTPNRRGSSANLPTHAQFEASGVEPELGPHGDHHLFAYDPPDVARLLTESGLEAVRVRLVGASVMSDRLGRLKRLLPVGAIYALSALMCATPGLGPRLGYTILATARKR